MNIRFYHARILTMAEGMKIIEGELHVKGNRIAYVGAPGKKAGCAEGCAEGGGKECGCEGGPDSVKWDREIDAGGNLLMPGFKNAHTHSGMTFLRSFADDLPLQAWLNEQIFPMEAKLTGEDIYELSKLAILEYLTSGITANFDMYLTPETIARASSDMGFRTVLCGAVNDFSQSAEELEQWYQSLNGSCELISFRLGFHAEYTTSEPLLRKIADLARKYQAPVFTHNSETRAEVEQCLERNGMTPTAYLDSLGMFDYGGGGFHSVYMTEEDLDIFREKGLSVITNPGSNTKLASGIAPIRRMMEKGINIGIGTDGPASNNCLDMFREMFLTTGLAKLKDMDAAAVDADQVLYMAVAGGAKAMGLDACDTLEEGKLADLILIDLQQPNMQPLNNITKNLVYSGSKQNVKLTMVNGKILYENGEFFVGEAPGQIYEKAQKIIERCQSGTG